MHAYVCLANARRATGFSVFASSDFARHGRFLRNFQLFPSFLHGFLELCIFRIDEINTSQLSCIVDLRCLDKHTFAFLFVELLLTYLSIFLATGDLAWMLLAFSSAALRTRYIRLEASHSIW